MQESACKKCISCIRFQRGNCNGLVRYWRIYCPIRLHEAEYERQKSVGQLVWEYRKNADIG